MVHLRGELSLDTESFPSYLVEHLRQENVGELTFTRGSVIFEEDAEADEAFFTISGTVCIHKKGQNGQRRILGRMKAGDLFGEMALLQQCRRSATAEAETDCHVFVIPRHHLLKLVTTVPRLAVWLLVDFCRRQRRADSAILQMELSQVMNARIILTQDSERARIARELQDGVIQHLAAQVMQAQILLHVTGRTPQELLSEVTQLRTGLIETLNRLKNAVPVITAEDLEFLGLKGVLVKYVGNIQAESGLLVHFRCPSIPVDLLSIQEQNTVFYLVQAALFNAAHCSKARNAELTIAIVDRVVNLTMVDDGLGIDMEQVGQGFHYTEMANYDAMRERTRLVGGTMKLRSEPGHGTSLEVSFPIASR
jgi:signal transduction histidine kinase